MPKATKAKKPTDKNKAWSQVKMKEKPYQSETIEKVKSYSNDAFELWYVLHYKDTSGELHRDVYFDFLGKMWDINYRKTGKTIGFAKEVYQKLENDPNASQSEAIRRAARLFESQNDKIYSEQNPCTTVFELIVELNKYLKK